MKCKHCGLEITPHPGALYWVHPRTVSYFHSCRFALRSLDLPYNHVEWDSLATPRSEDLRDWVAAGIHEIYELLA